MLDDFLDWEPSISHPLDALKTSSLSPSSFDRPSTQRFSTVESSTATPRLPFDPSATASCHPASHLSSFDFFSPRPTSSTPSQPRVLSSAWQAFWVAASARLSRGEMSRGETDEVVHQLLLGIAAEPGHPFCRSQLAALLLSALQLHPARLEKRSSLESEIDVIAALDDADDDSEDADVLSSDGGDEMMDDEDCTTTCKADSGERERFIRQLALQATASSPPSRPSPPHGGHTEDPFSGAEVDVEVLFDKGPFSQADKEHETHRPASLAVTQYPRSLTALPQLTTSSSSAEASEAGVEGEEVEGVEGEGEGSEESRERLASIAYLSPDVSCALCGLFMYRPVTALCGHSFCQLCLSTFVDRLPTTASSPLSCPYQHCGEPLSLASRHQCVQLSTALERCFPREYAVSKLHSEAVAAVGAGNDAQAIALLTSALAQWPDTFALYSQRLCCYLRLCQFEAAMGDLRQCVQLMQPLGRGGMSPSSSSEGSDAMEPPAPLTAHQTLQTLMALGQAGLITRFYRLAIFSFASVLRLSTPFERSIDRQKVVQGLIDAYLAHISTTLQDVQLRQMEAQASQGSTSSSSTFASVSLNPSLSTFFSQCSSRSPVSPSSSSSLVSSRVPSFYSTVRRSPRRVQELLRPLADHPTSNDIADEFHCHVCMELLYEPVTTVCGHTFCRLCLARSLDHKNLCPFCRVSLSVHISPTRQAVNVGIKAILQRWCERPYERRHAAVVAELHEQSDYLPIFVCTLMFPGVACPLHVFEPRYRLMIRSCLESGYNRFGMVVQVDREGNYASVGCTAEVRNVRLLPDGRSLVDTVGGRRFTVKERSTRHGYDVAKVEWLDDTPVEEQRAAYAQAVPSLEVLQAAVQLLVQEALMPRLINTFDLESQLGVMPSMVDQPTAFCYWLCAVLPMRMDDKFAFLQFRTEYERFRMLYDALVDLSKKEVS